MRIAVLVKQIPVPTQLSMLDGRIVRSGVDLEVNAYCRRANASAVELAGAEGSVVVFTMGPPAAADALREMIACGAGRGVHLCDPAFAGSDTLATARALAAALRREGPFDLVLAGLNSLDADTGQVPAEVAEMLGLPFAAGIRSIELTGPGFTARLETDDGYREIAAEFPAVLSTAERLCVPSKATPEQSALVSAELLTVLGPADLGLVPAEVGAAGSPTSVGPVRVRESTRLQARPESVAAAVALLEDLAGASDTTVSSAAAVPQARRLQAGRSGSAGTAGSPEIWCFFDDLQCGAELLGAAAELAERISGTVSAVTPDPVPTGLGAMGADRVLAITAAREPEQWADALATAAAGSEPWALLVEGTRPGRVVASLVAARHGWGLTGDAIEVDIDGNERLVAWKPAFGGQLEAAIVSGSPVQMATVRPGVLSRRVGRNAADPDPVGLTAPRSPRIRTISHQRVDDAAGELCRARIIVAVGQGVDPVGYGLIEELCGALGGAALGATRKVTDRGWLPRSRQIGVTGHSVAPRLLVAIGSSGRFNHTVGIRNAALVLALNSDPEAAIFDQADVGLVGRWQELVPELVTELTDSALVQQVPESGSWEHYRQ